jgi:hypothetical protein
MNGTTPLSTSDFGIVPTSWKIAGTGDFNGGKERNLVEQYERSDLDLDHERHTVSSTFDLGIVPSSWMAQSTGAN